MATLMLFLMTGASGSGKTTWSSRHHGQSAVQHWLSRAGRILHDLRTGR